MHRRRPTLRWCSGPVAQRIERRTSNPCAEVRLLPGPLTDRSPARLSSQDDFARFRVSIPACVCRSRQKPASAPKSSVLLLGVDISERNRTQRHLSVPEVKLLVTQPHGFREGLPWTLRYCCRQLCAIDLLHVSIGAVRPQRGQTHSVTGSAREPFRPGLAFGCAQRVRRRI